MGCILKFFRISLWWYFMVFIFLLYHANANQLNNLWLNSYLDDVLALPITLGLALMVIRNFVIRDFQYTFSNLKIISVVIIFSVYFEFIVVAYQPKFTPDYWDILAYGIGGFIFKFLINKPYPESNICLQQNNC